MRELRHSTTVIIPIGPFVNSTGVTPVTNLTIDAADEAEFLKYGTNTTLSIDSTLTAIANCDGYYLITISAAVLNTLGQLTVAIQDDSACLPYREYFSVVDAPYWDNKYAGTIKKVDVDSIGGTTQTAADLKDFADTGYNPSTHVVAYVNVESIRGATQTATDLKDFADTGYDPVTHKIETVKTADVVTTYTGNTPQTGDSYAVVSNVTYGNSALNTDLDTLLTRIVGTILAGNHTAQSGDGYSLLANVTYGLSALKTIVDAIQAKTDNLPGSMPKNVALPNFEFVMKLSSDHFTGATSKTVSGYISKDGAATFSALTNSVTEKANGVYNVDITQTEMNADIITLRFAATDCDDTIIIIKTDS